jgi:hypothetical protein
LPRERIDRAATVLPGQLVLPPTRPEVDLILKAALIDEPGLLRDHRLHHRAALWTADGLGHRPLHRKAFFPFGRFRDRLVDDYPLLALGGFLDVMHRVVAFVADLGFANGLHDGHPLFPFGRFQDRLGNRVATFAELGLPDRPVTRLTTLLVLRLALKTIRGRLTLLVLRLIHQLVFAPLAAHASGGRIGILGGGDGRPDQAGAQQHECAYSVHFGLPRSLLASTQKIVVKEVPSRPNVPDRRQNCKWCPGVRFMD